MPVKIWTFIAKALPLFLVFLCTGFGLHIFREVPPQVSEGLTVTAASLFRLALIFLLWRVRIYPTSLKKLGRFLQIIIEFLLGMFIVEYLQADFWVPLEAAVKNSLGKLSEATDKALQWMSIEDSQFPQFINNNWTVSIVIYAISLFFYITALHAAKIIDLREAKFRPQSILFAILAFYWRYLQIKFFYRDLNQSQTNQKGSNDGDDNHSHQNSIPSSKCDLKSTERRRSWRKELERDLTCDEDYSDFEIDYNE